MSDEDLSAFYAGFYDFQDIYTNEFLFIKNREDIIEKILYKGDNKYQRIRFPIINKADGTMIKPRNPEQYFAIALLQDLDIKLKLLCAPGGAGKDYLMLNQALNFLDKGLFKKIVFIRPNLTVGGVPDIGYIPGKISDKMEWTLGPFQDILGGQEKLKTFLNKGTIEVVPMPFLRGRSFDDSIVYVTEGQNMDSVITKLLITRVGNNSQLWINGDTDQIDKQSFKKDNGLELMIEKLKGNPLFGFVQLVKIERSDVANLASLL